MSAIKPLASAAHIKISRKINFIYASGYGFSGQRFASEMLVEGLRQRGWQVRVITTPILDRVNESGQGNGLGEKLILGLRLLAAWWQGIGLALDSEILYVNLGQTRFALLRDGLPLLIRSVFGSRRKAQGFISLHGNVFMGWDSQSLEAQLLRRMAQAAYSITVLGPNQKNRLIELGLAAEKVVQMDNTCLIAPITEHECLEKQVIGPTRPLKILYLSSLIESKGYPEFVEAIAQLANQSSLPIEATLCGKIMIMDSAGRFVTHGAAKDWLENHLSRINQSTQVRLHWINGAEGQAKEKLLGEAHIFILPSHYKVEAQPIAILEALASGCAIITSKVGEIPAMVSPETALLLDQATPETIAEAIIKLQTQPNQRQSLALNGLKLFNERFAYAKHLDRWETLLYA